MREPKQNSHEARRWHISRRAFLRGVGVTMSLPWLESLPTWGEEVAPAAGEAAAAFPKRMAILFWGNGVNSNHWWAKGAGAEMELGKSLEPLAPFKTRMNVISGLFNRSAVGVGIHPGQTGNLLSGMPLTKGAVLHGGVSMDQVLANQIGQDAVQPSMVLGCEQPVTGYHESNFSMAYSSHISWQNADSPVPMEVYPSLAFDSLFENRGSRRMQSILDRVKDEASSLQRKVSSTDKAKIDEYLASVREVEKRVEKMRTDQARGEAAVKEHGPSALFTMKRPDNGLPEDIREHMRLMCDIVALGFQTDKTRVASLLLCRDLSGLFYPFLDVRKSHHPASHEDLSDAYERITRYYVSQAAYLAEKLSSMPEGNGNVLDHSCIMFLSNMWSGSKHDSTKLPIVLIGGLSGTLETGRVLDYRDKGDDNRKVCSLYLSLMDKMGVKLPHFGDAEARLAEI
jgi:hypothetical protein